MFFLFLYFFLFFFPHTISAHYGPPEIAENAKDLDKVQAADSVAFAARTGVGTGCPWRLLILGEGEGERVACMAFSKDGEQAVDKGHGR